jgi:hypothetical protein
MRAARGLSIDDGAHSVNKISSDETIEWHFLPAPAVDVVGRAAFSRCGDEQG